MKVGVMIPTYNRPDFVRQSVLQWISQTRKPDILCIHQNGNSTSYEWAVEDLKPLIPIKYLHEPATLPQHFWYAAPLAYLLGQHCDVYLWADHDDIYFTNHVETVIRNLEHHDITLSSNCGLLKVKDSSFSYSPSVEFSCHAPGGMSSSVAMNKAAAEALKADLLTDRQHYYSDNVLAHVTMPKFKVNRTSQITTVYVAHKGTVSSAHWLDQP